MRRLLAVTAVIELGASGALLCCPSVAVMFLLGSPLDTPTGVTIGRVAGVALLALGVACWLARRDERSGATKGVVAAMTLYNFGAVVVLGAAGILARPAGVALWPAVVLHAGMTGWCIACLRPNRG